MPCCSRADAEQETLQIIYNDGAGADSSRAVVTSKRIYSEGDQIENQPHIFITDTDTDIYRSSDIPDHSDSGNTRYLVFGLQPVESFIEVCWT